MPPPLPSRQKVAFDRLFQEALSLHRQGRLADAAHRYRAALGQDRNHFDALYNLGVIEVQRGNFDSAAERLAKAIRQRPQSAEAENVLGIALRGLRRFEDSVEHFHTALRLKPDFADAHYNLAGSLRELGRKPEAAHHYRETLALNAAQVQAQFDFAMLLQQMGDAKGAIARYDAALALRPQLAAAHNGRAHALREIGRIEEAQAGFVAAIALEPDNAEYHYNFAYSKPVGECDPEMARLKELAGRIDTRSDEDRILLHFALGKALGDIEQYQRSAHHFLAGNALKRQYMNYDAAEAVKALESIAGLFCAEVVEERRGLGNPSEAPVFIVGMPRSGSTLAEQILASHPGVAGSGELMDFAHAVAGLEGPQGLPSDVNGEELFEMGARYLARVGADRKAKPRVTDKMLGNFRLVGLIHLALPNARIIHTSRDPLDTCLSCFSHLFALGQAFSYDLAELGRYYRAYERLMAHWRQVVPARALLDVQYENVVADLEGEARRMIAFCGLEWDARCLDFHRTERPIKTASVTQVRRPVYRSSIGRWKPYREMLAPLFAELALSPPDVPAGGLQLEQEGQENGT